MKEIYPGIFKYSCEKSDLERSITSLSNSFGEILKHERSNSSGCVSLKFRRSHFNEYHPIGESCCYLPPHTDSPHLKIPPTHIVIGCLATASYGGETTLVDGLKLYESALNNYPKEVHLLKNVLVRSKRNRSEGGYNIFSIDEKRDIVVKFRNDYAFKNKVPKCVSNVFAYIESYINNPRNQFVIKLRVGDVVIIDNSRWLHGRRAFPNTSERHYLRVWYNSRNGEINE